MSAHAQAWPTVEHRRSRSGAAIFNQLAIGRDESGAAARRACTAGRGFEQGDGQVAGILGQPLRRGEAGDSSSDDCDIARMAAVERIEGTNRPVDLPEDPPGRDPSSARVLQLTTRPRILYQDRNTRGTPGDGCPLLR
jgi:hypothetical protein